MQHAITPLITFFAGCVVNPSTLVSPHLLGPDGWKDKLIVC